MAVNWGALQTPDIAGAFQQGMETGRKNRIQRTQDNALSALGQNPNDPGAFNALMGVNPELATNLRRGQREEQTYQREQQTRNALMGAYDPVTGKIDPAKARGAYAGTGDIEGAMKFDQQQREAEKAQIEQGLVKLEAMAQLAGSAVDQETYEDAIRKARELGLDTSKLPPTFDPERVDAIRTQALDVKGQLEERWKAKEFDLDERQFAFRQEDAAADRAVQLRGQDITVRGQNMTDARVREGNMISAAGISKNERKTETDLRKEFSGLPIAKDFNDVRSSMGKIRGLANKPNATAADDIALIFSYMKMLDPGSVVREGEFANAQNAAGIPDRVKNAYNRALSGNMLNAQQRKKFGASAAQVYKSAREQYNSKADEYRRYARDYGVDPDRVASKYVPTRRGTSPKVVDFNDLTER